MRAAGEPDGITHQYSRSLRDLHRAAVERRAADTDRQERISGRILVRQTDIAAGREPDVGVEVPVGLLRAHGLPDAMSGRLALDLDRLRLMAVRGHRAGGARLAPHLGGLPVAQARL